MERWQKIAEAPAYSVSSQGRVRRDVPDYRGIGEGRILAPSTHRRGYLAHVLCVNGRKITRKVHRLVCEAFNGPQPVDRPHCAHRDGDVANNAPENLYWASALDNMADRERHGRTARGERSGAALHPEKWVRGDQHWTRRNPDKVLRGDIHPRRMRPETGARGEQAGSAKLTEAQAKAIITAPAGHGTGRALSEKYGVSMGLITAIRKGRAWAHLPRPE